MNDESLAYYERALRVIPEQTLTFAKAAHQYPGSSAPRYARSASGCEITDVDGNRYIDYTMALGPFLLGYNHPRVTRAVIEQLQGGTLFSLPHPLEVELAERVTEIVPCAEKVRFYKNGADVAGLAVRLARSATGRRHVLQSGYHGHHDWYSFQLRDGGTLAETKQYTHAFRYNDLPGVEALVDQRDGDVAAIVVETAFEAPREGFLEGLRALCDRRGIVLVYDEMWTGFRFGLAGFQGYCGVTPDIGLFSKAIANGFPISVIAGRAAVMDHFGDLWGFTTFAGETLSMRAALETISEIAERNVADTVWETGAKLRAGLGEALERHGCADRVAIEGYDCRFRLTFADRAPERKAHIQNQFLTDGVLWNGMFVPSFAHRPEHLERTIASFDSAVASLA